MPLAAIFVVWPLAGGCNWIGDARRRFRRLIAAFWNFQESTSNLQNCQDDIAITSEMVYGQRPFDF